MKTIGITGATSGIELATAKRLAQDGFHTLGIGRNAGRCAKATTNPLEVVARKTLDRALKGKELYVPGVLNRTISALGKIPPPSWVAGIIHWKWNHAQKKWMTA